MESNADLMATMRMVGQTLLGMSDEERKLVRVTLDSAETAPKAAMTASVSFAVSIPAERASSIRIKTAEDVPQIFHVESIVSHEIVPASGETMKSYLLLSDVRHQVVAIVTDTVPAQAPEPSPQQSTPQVLSKTTPQAYSPTESSAAAPSSPTLRGTTTRQQSFGGEGELEASGAVGHSVIASTLVALVCTFSA